MTNSGVPTKAACAGLFVQECCVPFLLSARNPDGGWGYTPGTPSAAEPTCWALLAFSRSQNWKLETRNSILASGVEWLLEAQLTDGSWPAFKGHPEGCWVTALACRVLNESGSTKKSKAEQAASCDRGVRWLCDTWPAEGAYWRRWLMRWRRNVSRQDASLRGWSWTPGTASWVEPTSHALMLLKSLSDHALPRSARKRIELAEAMLYDRMCPGGGWNAGNPLIYNVVGIPRIAPTVWALLALADHPERAENQQSLEWLAGAYPEIQGPGSLALAHLCLNTYGRTIPALEPRVRNLWSANNFMGNVVVASWVAIALSKL